MHDEGGLHNGPIEATGPDGIPCGKINNDKVSIIPMGCCRRTDGGPATQLASQPAVQLGDRQSVPLLITNTKSCFRHHILLLLLLVLSPLEP